MKHTPHYESYLKILEEELIPAMGCTEPIAVALAAAKATEALGATPEACRVEVSGNIIKNVKAVTVPNTGGMKGLEAAVAAGIVGGRPDLGLEVLSKVTKEEIAEMAQFLQTCPMQVLPSGGDQVFYILVTVTADGHTADCEVVDFHTNITRIRKDGKICSRIRRVHQRRRRRLTALCSALRRSWNLRIRLTFRMWLPFWSSRSHTTPLSLKRA